MQHFKTAIFNILSVVFMETKMLSALLLVSFMLFSGCAQQQQSSNLSNQDALSSEAAQPSVVEQQNNQEEIEQSGSASEPGNSPVEPVVRKFTMEEIQRHAVPEDCHTVIHGKVYNFSGAAAKHPGGDRMYEACGNDGSFLFENKPGTGQPHSEKARSYLKNYEIGVLQD